MNHPSHSSASVLNFNIHCRPTPFYSTLVVTSHFSAFSFLFLLISDLFVLLNSIAQFIGCRKRLHQLNVPSTFVLKSIQHTRRHYREWDTSRSLFTTPGHMWLGVVELQLEVAAIDTANSLTPSTASVSLHSSLTRGRSSNI